MPAITKEDVPKLPRADVELGGIEWLADQRLRLTVVIPDGKIAHLIGTFARHLITDLHFDERTGGRPLTWDITYSELPGKGWHVLMDFAHKGAVEFDCSELQFDYVTNTA